MHILVEPKNLSQNDQAEAEPQEAMQGDGKVDDGGEDQVMESEKEEDGETKAKMSSRRQNEKLYSEEGMLNTKLQRAEKKRRKKANKTSENGDEMKDVDEDGDYDFKVDYKRGSEMEVEEEEEEEEESETTYDAKANRFELPEAELGEWWENITFPFLFF